jgi:hypothetical protein
MLISVQAEGGPQGECRVRGDDDPLVDSTNAVGAVASGSVASLDALSMGNEQRFERIAYRGCVLNAKVAGSIVELAGGDRFSKGFEGFD